MHHPKFGLLFLNDGSLVMYVSSGNLGTDTAIDCTWWAGSVKSYELICIAPAEHPPVSICLANSIV